MRAVALVMAMAATAQAAPSIEDRTNELAKFHTGEAFAPVVARAVELFGKPKAVLVKPDRIQLGWAVEDADMCWVIELAGERGYLTDRDVNGTDATEQRAECHKRVGVDVKAVPAIPEPAALDTDAAQAALATAFVAGNWKAIWDMTDKELRENIGSPAGWAHFAGYFTPLAGKVVKLGAVSSRAAKYFGWELAVPAIYEKGTLDLRVAWRRDGKDLKIVNLDLELPPALQKKPVDADAAVFAQHATEVLVGEPFAKFVDLMALGLQIKLSGKEHELGEQLHEILAKLGKITAVKVTKQSACRDGQCLELAVVGAKAKTVATINATYSVSHWEVVAFNIDQP